MFRFIGRRRVVVDQLFELGRAEPYHEVMVWADVYRDERSGQLWAVAEGRPAFRVA